MSLQTPRLSLPLLAAGQAQKHVTHNEALTLLDALVHLSVLDELAAPPADVPAGARYLVQASPSAAFAGHAGDIAIAEGGVWQFLVPRAGWLVWVEDVANHLLYDGTAWRAITPSNLAQLGISATADASNRLAVSSPQVLFSHAGTSARIVVNKSTVGETASLIFQNNWSGRAEVGLAGSDALKIKVSADGSQWRDALTIDPITGNIGIGGDPSTSALHLYRAGLNPINERVDSVASASGIINRKARGTHAAKTSLIEGDVVSALIAEGYGGANYIYCGNIRCALDGAPSSGTIPTRLEFLVFTPGTGPNEKMRITSDGKVGIGTNAPSARLDVNGAMRVASYSRAALPSASTNGAGALIYVSDETAGATLAFSDGTQWLRVTDRAVVS